MLKIFLFAVHRVGKNPKFVGILQYLLMLMEERLHVTW